jgi:CSLREA domain-containing protein
LLQKETPMMRFISGFGLSLASAASHLRRRGSAARTPRRVRPGLELLEDRTLLSTLTVLNLNDSGAGSLRQAILSAAADDTINFAVSGQITLTSGELAIAKDLTIAGPGANFLSISGNNASRLFNLNGVTATISGLTLTQGLDATSSGGGAVLTNSSNLTFDQVVVSNNVETSANGGAIEVNGGTLNITDSTFANNKDTGSDLGHGGAIDVAGPLSAAVTITGSTFNGNNALYGGAISLAAGSLSATNSTFTGNTSGQDGGAICTVLSGPTVTLLNDTIADNIAGGNGGGISLAGLPAATLGNSIVASNQNGGPSNFGPDISGNINSQDYNLFTTTKDIFFSGTTTHNQTVADPMLGPLADNGGPTQTMALLAGSPAIDAGNNSGVPANDQRGFSRDAQPDIGAFEVSHRIVVTTTADEDNGSADPAAGVGASLREAINLANSAPGGDTITFDPTVFATPQTITLTGGELSVTDDLTVDGPGANNLTVSGGVGVRVFHISTANASLDGLTIANAVLGPGQNGGGIWYDGSGTLTVSNSAITNNSANSAGGILNGPGNPNASFNTGTVNVVNSTLSGNQAGGGGVAGAIWNNGGTLNVTNSTLAGNVSNTNEAGGIWNSAGGITPATTTVLNSTISGNQSFLAGGGVWNQSGTVNVKNTIIAGNTSTTTASQDVDGAFTSQGNNLIGDTDGSTGFGGSDLTGTSGALLDPQLSPLGNYGGPTQTMALLPGSPAIDAGDNAGAPATDQRGQPRIVNGTVDLGAFEDQISQAAPVSPQFGTEGSVTDTFDLGSFSDSASGVSTWTVDVNWGDGRSDNMFTVTSQGSLGTLTHAFSEEGVFTVKVTVTDNSNNSQLATFDVNVSDADLRLGTLAPPTATEGATVSNVVLFHFTDANPNSVASEYTATVNWGDGTTEDSGANVSVVANAGGGFDVVGSHTYLEELTGNTFSVSVQDQGGSTASASNPSFAVADAPLTAGALTPPSPAFERTPISNAVLFHFSDANPHAAASDFTATVTWGDGTAETSGSSANIQIVANAGGGFDVVGSHTYLDEFSGKTFSVSVADQGGATANASTANLTVLEELLPGGVRGTPNERWLSEAYRDVLNRPIDAGGMAAWNNQLNLGTSRAAIVQALENSQEYRTDQVQTLYSQYLHRTADAGGLANDVAFLRAGGTVEQVAAAILGSPEYFQNRGGRTNSGFLAALYQDALGRPIDSSGAAAWGAQLSQGFSRPQVASEILGSNEYHRHLVSIYYNTLLERPADAGSSSWVNALNHGTLDESVIAAILASTEFYNKTIP